MSCFPQNSEVETFEEASTEKTQEGVKGADSFKHGWLAPYIEHDLTKSLRSSEKVELWLKAHFSHPIGQQLSGYMQENQGLQRGERTRATESVLTSLAALVISSGVMSTFQDNDNSRQRSYEESRFKE